MIKILVTFLLCIISINAYAHPHVWVYTDAGLNVKNKKLESISVKWQFDEMYSATFMLDADINRDNYLDKKEQSKIEKEVKAELYQRLNKFILIKPEGKHEIKDYYFSDLNINYDTEKEVVIYDFKLKLKNPINVNGHIKLAFLDYEYYIGFEQSYDLDLSHAKSCKANLLEDGSIEVYGGLLNPEVYQIECK